MAQVTVTLPSAEYEGVTITPGAIARWQFATNSYLELGSSLSDSGNPIFLQLVVLPRTGHTTNVVTIHLAGSQTEGLTQRRDFSTAMETNGTITFVASDNNQLVVSGIGDSTEPYVWTPSNATAVVAFADHVNGLTDRTVTVTFDDGVSVAPSWTDDDADTQAWITGDTIDFTVPAVDAGTPAPGYAVVGSLPRGLSFDGATRVLSGTAEEGGSGNIVIRATNSEGSADYTIPYTITIGWRDPSLPETQTLTTRAWLQDVVLHDIQYLACLVGAVPPNAIAKGVGMPGLEGLPMPAGSLVVGTSDNLRVLSPPATGRYVLAVSGGALVWAEEQSIINGAKRKAIVKAEV